MKPNPERDSRSEAVLKDQIAACDDMRHRHLVAGKDRVNQVSHAGGFAWLPQWRYRADAGHDTSASG